MESKYVCGAELVKLIASPLRKPSLTGNAPTAGPILIALDAGFD